MTHAEPPAQQLGDARDGRRDRRGGAVEIELGAVQPAGDEIAVSAELELELDFHRRAGHGAVRANGVARSAGRGVAVQRPRDGLENRRFAGAVGADDAREPHVEVDARLDVLPEIPEMQAVEPHQASIEHGGRRDVHRLRFVEIARCARATSAPRSMSASSGRARGFPSNHLVERTDGDPARRCRAGAAPRARGSRAGSSARAVCIRESLCDPSSRGRCGATRHAPGAARSCRRCRRRTRPHRRREFARRSSAGGEIARDRPAGRSSSARAAGSAWNVCAPVARSRSMNPFPGRALAALSLLVQLAPRIRARVIDRAGVERVRRDLAIDVVVAEGNVVPPRRAQLLMRDL